MLLADWNPAAVACCVQHARFTCVFTSNSFCASLLRIVAPLWNCGTNQPTFSSSKTHHELGELGGAAQASPPPALRSCVPARVGFFPLAKTRRQRLGRCLFPLPSSLCSPCGSVLPVGRCACLCAWCPPFHPALTLARRVPPHPSVGRLGLSAFPPATNRAPHGGPRQGSGERVVRSLGFGRRIRTPF